MSLLSACILTIFITLSSLLAPASAQATTPDPKTEVITVSATIIDNIPPTTPILISPENNSYVTTGYVTFIWKGSTDANGIKEYELSLDGKIYIPDIPPNDTQTSKFTLDYEASTQYYTLRVKELVADGTHTWKIRANDMLDNGTDSATWSFIVDTQAPSFILTQVGDALVSISAQDLSTVPEDPIELEKNEPQLLGTSEANSTVVLAITIPGDPTQIFTATADINGNWSQQLGILPRDTIMTLDFAITDQAGLISVLNNVQLIVKTKVFTYPPTSSSPLPSPLISIPLIPPIEITHEILQETWEHLPAPLKAIVATVPPGVRTYIVTTAVSLMPISALLFLAFFALLALMAMTKRFGKKLSPHLIWRTLQALHLIPAGKAQGLVYDSQTNQGVPFALVEVRNENKKVVDSVVTDKHGFYRGLILKKGKYDLVVSHPDYSFPTNLARPENLTIHEFYCGETFAITDKYEVKNQILYLIPVDLLETDGLAKTADLPKPSGLLKITDRSLCRFSQFSCALFLPLFVATGILTLIFPSVWNCLVFGGYCIEVIFKAVKWFRAP